MSTKLDARQIISRDLLDQIATAAGVELDNLLRSLNSNDTAPLKMSSTGTDRIVSIGSIFVTNPETSKNRTIPTISNALPNFTSGTITAPATGAGTITVSPGTNLVIAMTANQYLKVGINLDAVGNMTLVAGIAGASLAAATAPAAVSNTFGIGYFVLRTDGSNNVANILSSDLYQYVGGGGSGGSGNGNELLETIKNVLVDSTYSLVTANIGQSDGDDLISSFGGTASFDLTTNTFKFAAASDSITSVQMLDLEEFLGSYKDVSKAQLNAFWRAGSIDTAATYELSRDGGSHYQALTMSRVGSNTEEYHGEYEWTREEENAANQSQISTVDFATLTNVAGTVEAVAQKFTLSASTRITSIGVYLSKVGSPTGNYQIKLMQDNGSGNFPSLTAQIAASAQLSIASLTGSEALYSFSLDQTLAAGTYHIVIETDATYKSVYSAGVTTMRAHSDSSGSPAMATFDNGSWFSGSVGRMAHSITGWTEAFDLVNQYDVANASATTTLNSVAQQQLSQAFILSTPNLIKRVRLYMNRAAAAVGNMFVSIVKDDAGNPSANAADILCESSAVSISSIGTGNQTVLVDLPKVALPIGTYHIVIRTDAAYKAGTMDLNWRVDDTSPPSPNGKRYNGTTWSALASAGTFTYRLDGRPLDLRVRITSSAGSKLLSGYGLFYDPQLTGMNSGVKRVKRFDFLTTANTSTFTLDWIPDPDLLEVKYIQSGQVFSFPAFQIDGKNIVFPANTFYNGGISAQVTLIAIQNDGVSFDNSDRNAALLAGNFLGSTDSSVDRSVAGRGIFLRRPDGTLREITIDNNDNIVVYSI